MRKQFVDISYLTCTKCENVMSIPRFHGRRREQGHIKDMWCPYCMNTTKFREIGRKGFYEKLDGTIIYA